MSVTIPTILKYLSQSNEDLHFIKSEDLSSAPRAKKRRLDHLTWEEKVQRKKLKNRVAAQTSRDRKKAKMEEMEQALQELFYKNEELMKECKELRNANKRLTEENSQLHKQKCDCSCNQTRPVEYDVEKQGSAASSVPLPKGSDTSGLPSLSDLLNELDKDVDIDSLEQLTQSLLQDIAADLEAAAQKTNCEESNNNREDHKQPVVGSPPKELESSRCGSVEPEPCLEQEISPYLLLHHNYSAKQEPELIETPKRIKTKNAFKKTKLNTKTKPKLIMPKISDPAPVENSDILYGTLDESTNCITIIVDDSSLHLSEAVTEVVTTDSEDNSIIVLTDDSSSNNLQLPSETKDLNQYSPSYSASDCGYESLDSPTCIEENEIDMWDQSVCELFPMLQPPIELKATNNFVNLWKTIPVHMPLIWYTEHDPEDMH
ncbi:hypothetical protein RN001_012278 [Aquatica leii]|uniref:X-box-binding protein 1 n=1 Tax=Aquatica leii TaxID=1421715 RepID=A0AAN7P731_9COLE|nr:hypothetical protein RN001_012278 [Aquatica leii]